MFDEIRDSLQRKAGYKDASREIEELSDGIYTDEQIKGGRSSKLNVMNHPYGAGFSRRWIDFGAEDARRGVCQVERFDSQDYNLGWVGQIDECHKLGWRHPSLDKQLEELFPSRAGKHRR